MIPSLSFVCFLWPGFGFGIFEDANFLEALTKRGVREHRVCAWSSRRWKKSSVYLAKSSRWELCQ